MNFSLIKSIKGETGNKVVYRITELKIDANLIALGKITNRFVVLFKSTIYGEYHLLVIIYEHLHP